MKKSIFKLQKGFTLTELLISIAITSILLVGIMSFLVTTLADNSAQKAKADLLRETQLTLDAMTKDIRLSANANETNSVIDYNSPDAVATSGLGWASNENTLVLSKSVEDEDRNIIFQDETHYITEKNNIVYFTDNGNLYKRTLAVEVDNNRSTTSCPESIATEECPKDVRLVQNVESFQLRYFDGLNNEVNPDLARSVEATLVLSVIKYNQEIRADYTTRMVFRNE